MAEVDAVVFGTGEFSARILFDMAATATTKVNVLIVGRDEARLAWLRTAANGRATIFGTAARFSTEVLPSFSDDGLGDLLHRTQPALILQTASLQTASVLRSAQSRWSRLIAEGGLSVTAPIQAAISIRVGRAAARSGCKSHFVNACFPDVTNQILTGLGIPVLCGVGNVGSLSAAMAGDANARETGRIKVLAHYQHLAIWRKTPGERSGPAPRVWIDDVEVADVFNRFRTVMLSPQIAFELTGATNAPMLVSLATGGAWEGHAPGVHGRAGGYPVRFESGGTMTLALPAGLSEAEAVAWNEQFEQQSGLVFDTSGRAQFTGRLRELLAEERFAFSDGFDVADALHVAEATIRLRDRLQEVAA